MLVLSRRLNEKILLPGTHTSIQVVEVQRGAVRLGIEAPPDVIVLREELYRPGLEQHTAASPASSAGENLPVDLAALLRKRLAVLNQGIALLRRQLEDGLTPDAAMTLDELEDEVRRLGYRLQVEWTRAAPAPAAVPHAARRALLVEDDPLEREAMAQFLRKAGLEVDVAGDGIDALDHLRRRGRPDVVLLDMGLPRCDGPTTVRVVRDDPAYAGLKILAVSGHTSDEFDLGSGPSGVDRWFQKPIDPGMLVREVMKELDPSPRSA